MKKSRKGRKEVKDSGSTQGNKDIELKKKKRRGEKPYPTLFFTRRKMKNTVKQP